MGYSTEANIVRVDIFKPSGKWSETIALEWQGYRGFIFDEFQNSLEMAGYKSSPGYFAVCLEPYSETAHPIIHHFK